ncbi:11433_t:CDS:10, partial [Scutellospora calospora]
MDNQGQNKDSEIGDLNSKSNNLSDNVENYERADKESSKSNDKSSEVGAEIDPEEESSRYDLCESIPGLYRLLDLCKDKGSNGLVDKILISQQDLKKLCNEMVPNSFKSISKIQFEQLNSCHVHLIGCYGRNDLIAKLLLNKNVIDQVIYEQLLIPYEINTIQSLPTLRPGIYLQRLPSVTEDINSNPNKFLVIHWSEIGCYEDSASYYRKKNMTNLHRSLKILALWINLINLPKNKNYQDSILSIASSNTLELVVDNTDEEPKYDEKSYELITRHVYTFYYKKYLTKITTHQLCLMDDSDVENFDWSLLKKNFDDEDGENKENRAFIHKYEVRKSQEKKEDFELFKGFNLPLPMSNIQSSYTPKYFDGPPLHPLIVESASNQILLTRKMKYGKTTADKYSKRSFDSLISFQEHFKKLKIQKCALLIDRNKMTIQKLQILVEDGINVPEDGTNVPEGGIKVPDLFLNYNAELKEHEDRKVEIVSKVLESTLDRIKQMAYQILKQSYNHFELLISGHENDEIQIEESKSLISDHKLNYKIHLGEDKSISIDEIYPGIIQILKNEIFNISTNSWKCLKTRLIFAKHCGFIKASTVFNDEEQDFSKLINKYKNNCNLFSILPGKTVDKINDKAKKIYDKAEKIPDNEFVKQISDINDEAVTKKFLNAYLEWKELNFVQKVNRIVQDIREKVEKNLEVKSDEIYFKGKLKEIEEYFFQSICKKIEAKYPTNDLTEDRLTILNLEIDEYKKKYYLDCEISEKLCFSIYNVNLNQSDIEEMDKNEFFIPKPIISNNNVSFNIDPEIYEFNINSINRLQSNLDSQTTQKKLSIGRNFMVAINEPKHMIAIYDNDKGLLNTYRLDDEQNNIHLQYRNIQISQWYNLNIPQIAHMFFIKSTEDVCFVEKNGSARIYNGACFVAFVKEKSFVKTSEVDDKLIEMKSKDMCTKMQVENSYDIKPKLLSTNDTIELSNIDIETKNNEETAFISQKNLDSSTEPGIQKFKSIYKENETISENMYTKMQAENSFDINDEANEAKSSSIDNTTKNNKELATISQESVDNLTESKLQQNTMVQSKINNSQVLNIDIVHGYVFFLEKFSKNANKVIEVPFDSSTIEFFQFCSLANKQTHLITIDLHNNNFQSLMVKVTQMKAKYRFERKTVKKSLGKVKIERNDPFTVLGQNTKFTIDFHVGDLLVIGNEKFQIMKIVNDCELKIINQQKLNFEEWQQFNIEPRTKVNGLLDVYSMVFTKYAITNPFSKKDELLKLTIVLELSSKLNIDNYKTKFQTYFRKLFKKYKKETKKPMGHLEKFGVNCIIFESFDNLVSEFTEHKFGDWIIDFFCLIPIQIAVAHDNEFIPIRDGFLEKAEQNVFDDGFGLIGNISKAISFGWYESIFEYYADLEVKVISSMGEQSSELSNLYNSNIFPNLGKSYLLNHCLGSTFDGSAMRCTEVKIDEILYVALDFEGLASIERSPQEETFLQLLNAALSNLVIFKSNFTVSRDISSMFQRFQDAKKK